MTPMADDQADAGSGDGQLDDQKAAKGFASDISRLGVGSTYSPDGEAAVRPAGDLSVGCPIHRRHSWQCNHWPFWPTSCLSILTCGGCLPCQIRRCSISHFAVKSGRHGRDAITTGGEFTVLLAGLQGRKLLDSNRRRCLGGQLDANRRSSSVRLADQVHAIPQLAGLD